MEQQYAAQIKFLTHHLDKASADVANMQYYMEKNTAPGSFDAYLKDEVDELRVKYQNFIKAEQSWISDRRIVEETHKAEIEVKMNDGRRKKNE